MSRPATREDRVVIAGGGIAGLVLAITLARAGIASLVLEARPAPSEAGAGIQLGPNATHILREIDVLDALTPSAVAPQYIQVANAQSGKHIVRLPLGEWIEARHEAPYLVAHRADLQQALLERASAEPNIEMQFDRKVTGLDSMGNGSGLVTADGEIIATPLAVGADGIWSALRADLAGGYVLRYAGTTAARALVATTAMPEPLRETASFVWLAHKAHIVMYPVRGGTQAAFVVITSGPQQEAGWGGAVDRSAFLARFSDLDGTLRGALDAADDWRQWSLFDPAPQRTWSFGNVQLIGDAAHPMLPFIAQGGAMAIEDGFVLARLIARHGPDPGQVFPAFEALRTQRVGQVQRTARENGRIYHLGGLAARGRDLAMKAAPPQRLMARYDWIYGWRYDPDHGEVEL